MYAPMAFSCSKNIEQVSNIWILKFIMCLSCLSEVFVFWGTSKFSQFQGYQNRATWWPAFLYSVFLFDSHWTQGIKKTHTNYKYFQRPVTQFLLLTTLTLSSVFIFKNVAEDGHTQAYRWCPLIPEFVSQL